MLKQVLAKPVAFILVLCFVLVSVTGPVNASVTDATETGAAVSIEADGLPDTEQPDEVLQTDPGDETVTSAQALPDNSEELSTEPYEEHTETEIIDPPNTEQETQEIIQGHDEEDGGETETSETESIVTAETGDTEIRVPDTEEETTGNSGQPEPEADTEEPEAVDPADTGGLDITTEIMEVTDLSVPESPEEDTSLQETTSPEISAEAEPTSQESEPETAEKETANQNKQQNTAEIKESSEDNQEDAKSNAVKKPGKTRLLSVKCVAKGLQISWKAVSGAKGYYIYWWHPTKKKYVKFAQTTGTLYVDKTAKNGTKYWYTVAAYNDAGTGDWDYGGLSGVYVPPATITKLSNKDEGVSFSWKSVPGVSGYRIYWRYKGGSWTKWKNVTGTSLDKAGAKSGYTYEYLVRPYLKLGGEVYWAAFDESYKGTIRYLSTPRLLNTADAPFGLEISWEGVKGADGYWLYYWNNSQQKYVYFAKTTSTSYVDPTAKAGKKYYYTVCAYSKEGGITSASNWDYHGIVGMYKTCKVLIIGNSLTQYYVASCPEIISSLAEKNGQLTYIKKLIKGGAYLSDFTYGNYRNLLRSALQLMKYDAIVLQEESWTACSKPGTYLRNINDFMNILAEYGQNYCRIVLYSIQGCTHIYGTSYDDYEKNTLVNLTLAAERIKWKYGYDVVVAKAGELHMQVRYCYPYVNLMNDGNHPNYTGFYLSSMRLYNAIYNRQLQYTSGSMQEYVELNNKYMSINYPWVELDAGQKVTLKVSKSGSSKVTWTSYNPGVATVSSSGVVRAVSKGKAVILAQSAYGYQQTCVVYVN